MAELANDTPASMKGAVFEAFRGRERNGVLASAGVGLVTALVAIVGSFVLIYQGAFAEIAAWQNDLAPAIIPADPAETPPPVLPLPPVALFALIPGALATMFLIYVAMAAFEAACLRWMLRGGVGRAILRVESPRRYVARLSWLLGVVRLHGGIVLRLADIRDRRWLCGGRRHGGVGLSGGVRSGG